MAPKKAQKKSSKRIGDPNRRPKVKPAPKKEVKPKGVLPKAGDYFTAMINGIAVRGIVGTDNYRKCLVLYNPYEGNLYFDGADLHDSLGFEVGVTYRPKDHKMDESGTLRCGDYPVDDYTVVTTQVGKLAIDKLRQLVVLNYGVTADNGGRSFTFGCGAVTLDRSVLETFVKVTHLIPAKLKDDYYTALNALCSNGEHAADVNVKEVEEVLATFPLQRKKQAKKPAKKRKK